MDIHRDAIMAAAKYQLVLQLHAVFSYRSYGPELFYLFDEIRDQIPPFVGVFIPVAVYLPVRSRWYDCARNSCVDLCGNPPRFSGARP